MVQLTPSGIIQCAFVRVCVCGYYRCARCLGCESGSMAGTADNLRPVQFWKQAGSCVLKFTDKGYDDIYFLVPNLWCPVILEVTKYLCKLFPPFLSASGKNKRTIGRPHGQLILTSVSGLLVLYFPVIFFIPLMPYLKISFFLPMSLLSSRLFCFRFSFSISLSALPISTLRRAFHLSCCLTSFWNDV